LIVCVPYCKLIVFLFRCNEIVLVLYQLLFDFRQGVRENLTKAQRVRVGWKVKNHCATASEVFCELMFKKYLVKRKSSCSIAVAL